MKIHNGLPILVCSILTILHTSCGQPGAVRISGELKIWHPVSLAFMGPETGETADPNPFTDFRLSVSFTGPSGAYIVPGYYAADGNSAETGAESGSVWRVHFVPDAAGEWQYRVSFRRGSDIAIDINETAGEAVSFDGTGGEFTVEETDKSGRDFRGKGMLRYTGGHYLQFAGSKEYFLKVGAGSPENFLAYKDFDGTHDVPAVQRPGESAAADFLHAYAPHTGDWHEGDPSWQGGKGKGIIGALNYLAGKGMNSVYFLTMNVGGDGNDVWPWIDHQTHDRFDCSKLDQWEIVFSHMDKLGLLLHMLQQETENDQLLDGGKLGPERKLYYRELIARFGHHLGLIWNLGEENTNTDEERKDFCGYIKSLDPYDHPVVMHTYPNQWDEHYAPLLGFEAFDGPSLQDGMEYKIHEEIKKWTDESEKAGRKWVIMQDEQLAGSTGVKPDTLDYWHDPVRRHYLWGSFMAGAAGVEWYFGYLWENHDLNCEDWRSRDHMWDMTRMAAEFFKSYLPFTEMKHADELTPNADDFCFAKKGEVYTVYVPGVSNNILNLEGNAGAYTVFWFNPRTGGALMRGSVQAISGPGTKDFGSPPEDAGKDWVALIRRE